MIRVNCIISNKLKVLADVNLFKYLTLNYFTKKVVKEGRGRIIPYKGAVIDLAPGAVIRVGDKDILIGTNKLKHSKIETYVRLRESSSWDATGGCDIAYGSTIEVLKDAKLMTGYFTMNSFSTIVASKRITLGNDVMIARDVIIYDSDFHQIKVEDQPLRKEVPVSIGDHVWLGSRSIILKGVTIGENSMVSAGTIVTSDVNEGRIVSGVSSTRVLKKDISWDR